MAWFFLAILVAYSCAVVASLLRYRLQGRAVGWLVWCFVPLIMLCPLLIPSGSIGPRAAAAFASGDITLKMVDYFRHWNEVERRMVLREFYHFLIPFPVLSVVYPYHKRRLARPEKFWPQLLRLVGGVAGFLLALLAVQSLSGVALIQSSFTLNHVSILPMFVLAIESLSRAICAFERLLGFDTTPIVRHAYLARTVPEFWRRYNVRVHEWLYRNVFRSNGGRHAPRRSVLRVFLVSGLFHEVAFATATSRLTGYQFVFFAIQGPAVLISGRLERLASRGGPAGRVVTRGLTILFFAATSVFFFDGVSKIFPFIYTSRSPLP